MGNTFTLRACKQTLSGCPRYYHPSGRQHRKEGIIGNNYPCTDYGITHRHKTVSTSVTSKRKQGCTNPIYRS